MCAPAPDKNTGPNTDAAAGTDAATPGRMKPNSVSLTSYSYPVFVLPAYMDAVTDI